MSMKHRSRGFGCSSAQCVETLERRTLMSAAVSQSFWSQFGGDPQHTAVSSAASQPLQAVHWKTAVDLNPQIFNNEISAHYASPVITAANTVIVPVKTGATSGFELKAFNGATGALKWTLATDFIPAPSASTPTFAPALTRTGRLYFPGAGGTIWYADHLDANVAPTAHRLVFYGAASYAAGSTAFDASVYVDTPLTVSASGVIYFGYQVKGTNPLNLQGGIARISAIGHGIYYYAHDLTGDPTTTKVAHDCAPALSNDGKYVYVAVDYDNFIGAAVVRGAGSYLLCLSAASLRLVSKTFLVDPQTGQPATTPDGGTASPMVGPNGDVYFGVLENPFASNNDRGWMLHFNATLSVEKTPGAFGWDDTASVVPATMVKSYHGNSSYLILTKYNNYAGLGTGNGQNKLAILDPGATEIDPVSGQTVMKEVETVLGVTPDPQWTAQYPSAVREWCVNTVAVDPATDSALINSEDGVFYRWNLSSNKLTEKVRLTPGISEAYTPTVIGPDGVAYAIQDATLFAIGKKA